MFLWFSSFSRQISRSAELGTPCSSFQHTAHSVQLAQFLTYFFSGRCSKNEIRDLRSTNLPCTLSLMENEYQPRISDALQLGVKAGMTHSTCEWQVKLCDLWLTYALPEHCLDNRQHMSNNDCSENKREAYHNCSLLYCVQPLRTYTQAVLKVNRWFRFSFFRFTFDFVWLFHFLPAFLFCCCMRFSFFSTKPRDWLARTLRVASVLKNQLNSFSLFNTILQCEGRMDIG